MPDTKATTESAKRRRALIAVVLSGLFPGLGQLYNGQRLKAVLFAATAAVTAFGPLTPLQVDLDPSDLAGGMEKLLLASLPFLLIALWSVLDAFLVARKR